MYLCIMFVWVCVWGLFAIYLVVSIGCSIVVIGCNNRGESIGILSLKLNAPKKVAFDIDSGFD